MRALSISIRSGPAVLALLAGISAHAEQAQRFTLSRDQPALSDGKLVLRGYLQSRDAPSTAAIVQDGGRFTIMAKAVAVAQVCYNDTIFRDDFDGDGG
jgi:hypothetical protein